MGTIVIIIQYFLMLSVESWHLKITIIYIFFIIAKIGDDFWVTTFLKKDKIRLTNLELSDNIIKN